MIKINIFILLLFIVQFSIGQESLTNDFYSYLDKAIEKVDSDSITLTITEYGCLGSFSNYKVQIKNSDHRIKIDFYSERPKNRPKINSEFEVVLDTSFTVRKNILKKNLKSEITKVKSRPIFIANQRFKIIINQGGLKKEFKFKRSEGLYYILRYNKTYEKFFD